MDRFQILRDFEQFYHTIHPAKENSDQAFFWYSGIKHPLFNAVMHLRQAKNAEDPIDRILQEAPKDAPVSFWLHPCNDDAGLKERLIVRGFKPMIACPLMTWACRPITKNAAEIRPGSGESFHETLAAAFQFDEAVKEGDAKMMEGASAEHHEIFCQNIPVGTGTLFCRGKIGSLFNISVRPDWQQRGLGTSLTRFLMAKAAAKGIEELHLLSSPQAEKMYGKLGFKTLFEIEMYAR